MEAHDYSADVEDLRGDNILAVLQDLVNDHRSAVEGLRVAEENLKKAQDLVREIEEVKLVEAMEDAGQLECKVKDGTKLTVTKTLRASIPKGGEGPAFAFLEKIGLGSIIKREVKMTFGRGEDDRARAVLKKLREDGQAPETKLGVHNGTLVASLREALEDGKDVPLQLFGAFEQKKVKLK